MKDKMCHLSNTCSDYNIMSLTVGAQNSDLVSERLILHPNLESLVTSKGIQLPLLHQRKACVALVLVFLLIFYYLLFSSFM